MVFFSSSPRGWVGLSQLPFCRPSHSILEEFHFESGPSLYSGLSLEESPSQLKHVSLPLRGGFCVSNGCFFVLWTFGWSRISQCGFGSPCLGRYLGCWPKNSWRADDVKHVFVKGNGFHESKYGPGSIPFIYQVYKGPKYGCNITVYYVHYRIVVSRRFWFQATATPHQGVSNRRAWARVDYLRSWLGCSFKNI